MTGCQNGPMIDLNKETDELMGRRSMMVLGGSGQIGLPLCQYLSKQGIKVYNVDLILDNEHDLREDCRLADYWMEQVDFVFFLAYDIGGSKYLQTKQGKFDFLLNNTKIMTNVFSLLKKHNKPFIFASSVMAEMPWSPYGNLKRVGEHFTESLGGISTRFWNIYGPESDELKSHVITDFIKKAKTTSNIDMLTDGTEVRQFLYAEDCSKILLTLAEQYEVAREYKKFDVSNGVWSSINEVAEKVATHFKAKIIRPSSKDVVQNNSKIEPDLTRISQFWDPVTAVSLDEGIRRMIDFYEENDD